MKWAKSREGLESMTKELCDMIDRMMEDQRMDIARSMLNSHYDDSEITKHTGISETELNTLKSKMN